MAREIYNSPYQDANLQGYWRLEQNRNDTTTNAYNLVGSTPAYVTGMFGYGADFEKDSSEACGISDANCANLEISGSQTWMAWVKPESLYDFLHVFSKNSNGGGTFRRIYISSTGAVTFNVTGLTTNAAVTHSSTVSTGNWYHVAGVYDSTTSKLKVFLNGVKTEVTASGSGTDTNGDFFIGRQGGTSSNYFDGVIDDVAVWNRALSDYEIANIYNDTGQSRVIFVD